MAFTITPQLTGQAIDAFPIYCYLYEPLRINAVDTTSDVTKISVQLDVYSLVDFSLVESNPNYATFDTIPNVPIEIDLGKMAVQYHDANTFNVGVVSDLVVATDIPVSKYRYRFTITTDSSATTTTYIIQRLPLIGGRVFQQFTSIISQYQQLTEAEVYGVTLSGRWKNYPNISITLIAAHLTYAVPTITVTTESNSQYEPCGGMLIWKSRYGGWMYWGMDIATEVPVSSYSENLKVGMFEANAQGNPYVGVDYTKIDTQYNISLKALNLTSDELKAVSGLSSAVVAYYMATPTSKLELMRVTSSSAPISTLISGGDFSVGLKSISTTSQNAR